MTLEAQEEWIGPGNTVQIKDHLRYIHGFEKEKYYEVIQWGKYVDDNKVHSYGAKLKNDFDKIVWLRWYDVFE